MNHKFNIDFKKGNGNLYVYPRGEFDGMAAWDLLNFLYRQYKDRGRVFIDTSRLRTVHPFGCTTFRCRLDRSRLPADRIVFKGDKATALAVRGSLVLASADGLEARCQGNCAACPCSPKAWSEQ